MNRNLAIPSRFEVIRRIGEGGMGTVYEAVDLERDVRVAIKTVLHQDPEALARFKKEFRALQDIDHPNLVALGELLGEGGDVFFTMELVEGVDLFTWVRGETRRLNRTGSATAIDLPPMESHDTDRDRAHPVFEPTPASREHPSLLPSERGSFDEPRLRDAFKQIATGLLALHDAGKIHRDVKPSNVRVTPEGRVVLLDFGLVFDRDEHAHAQATETNIVGTPAYMAPEQAMAAPVGPEADWYAVGAMLYQCITGRLPFEGAAVAVMMAKHYQDPPSAKLLVPNLAPELDALCLALLQLDPQARPNGRDVLRRLTARPSSRPPGKRVEAPTPQSVSAPFVGRTSEMSALARALDDVKREKRAVSVALFGESGVGKSALARKFLDEARAGGALVLVGRCYEREAVAYKAFDEVIDALSRKIARLPKEDALALLPSRVDALAQLFPSFARVAVISQSSGFAAEIDPHDRRRGAFRALRELLRNVTARETLVIAIDDLQWTDADSVSLLDELLRPPDAPALLFLATMRGALDPNEPSGAPKVVRSIPGDVRPVHVGRLAKEDALTLAATLLSRDGALSKEEAAAIAREADGHPLFIDELVRHAATRTGAQVLRLDDALWTRVVQLDLSVRRVLEVACLLGAPCAQEVVAQAAGLGMRDFARAVALLRSTHFVRTRGPRVTDAIEPFHDRVREAVAARIDPDAKRECHARIAKALELSKGSDHEVLATHWAGAGEPAKGARYAIIAAEQAASALAFDRAARLFARGLELLPASDPRVRALREQLGDALAHSGECAKAAAEYERAADGASPADALDLRRRAAEQLLRSGQVVRGLDATRAIVVSVGLSLPRGRFAAIAQLLWYRFILRVRGLGFVPREAKDIPASELLRLDVCWAVSCTLGYADAIGGALFQARSLLLALRAGERGRVTRALAVEGGFLASTSRSADDRAQRTLAIARDAAPQGDPYSAAIVQAGEGLAEVFAFRFGRAVDVLERSIAGFRDHCPGTSWEVTTMSFFCFMSMFYVSRFEALRVVHESALKDAYERGDRYAAVMLRVGVLNRIWLVHGDPARARRELDEAMRAWPVRPFHIMHLHALVADVYIALYEGDPARAYDRLRSTEPELMRSLLLQVIGVRMEHAGLRARIALSMASDPKCVDREKHFRVAERSLRVFARFDSHVSRSAVASFRASLAQLRGNTGEALGYLDELARDESEEGWLAAWTARWVAALARGESTAAAAAKRELESRGVVADRRFVAVSLPSFERLL